MPILLNSCIKTERGIVMIKSINKIIRRLYDTWVCMDCDFQGAPYEFEDGYCPYCGSKNIDKG